MDTYDLVQQFDDPSEQYDRSRIPYDLDGESAELALSSTSNYRVLEHKRRDAVNELQADRFVRTVRNMFYTAFSALPAELTVGPNPFRIFVILTIVTVVLQVNNFKTYEAARQAIEGEIKEKMQEEREKLDSILKQVSGDSSELTTDSDYRCAIDAVDSNLIKKIEVVMSAVSTVYFSGLMFCAPVLLATLISYPASIALLGKKLIKERMAVSEEFRERIANQILNSEK